MEPDSRRDRSEHGASRAGTCTAPASGAATTSYSARAEGIMLLENDRRAGPGVSAVSLGKLNRIAHVPMT